MKTSGTYNNGQIVSEQRGDTLTYYHKDGRVKARGACIDGSFEGKWEFFKKEGFLWQIGHFNHNQKHGTWIRYKANGDIEKEQTFREGKLLK